MSAADDAILSEFVEACKERFKDNLLLRTYLFYETDSYPMTRKEAIKRLSKMEDMEEGISVMNMLENWDSIRAKVEENPDELLIIIEKFAREQIDRLSKI